MSTSTKFHPLSDNEKSCIMAAAKKGRIKADHPLVLYLNSERANAAPSILVSYENMQGGFCVCILELMTIDSGMSVLYRGASRRSYKDARNPIKGEMLAFSRAVLYSRPVELV